MKREGVEKPPRTHNKADFCYIYLPSQYNRKEGNPKVQSIVSKLSLVMGGIWSFYVFQTMLKVHAKGRQTILVKTNDHSAWKKLAFQACSLMLTTFANQALVPCTLITCEDFGYHLDNSIKMQAPIGYICSLLSNFRPTSANVRTSLLCGRGDIGRILVLKMNECSVNVCLIQVAESTAREFCLFQRRRLQLELEIVFQKLPADICGRISEFVAFCSMHKDKCQGKTYACDV